MKIVLIGFMGSGKSTVGAQLADQLGYAFVDLDSLLLQQNPSFGDIAEIFTKHGEDHFRALERACVRSQREAQETVISTGGGSIIQAENIEQLRAHGGLLIYLDTSFAIIQQRIGTETSTRPLFMDVNKAKTLYNTRRQLYEDTADIIIQTDTSTPQEVCRHILSQLKALT